MSKMTDLFESKIDFTDVESYRKSISSKPKEQLSNEKLENNQMDKKKFTRVVENTSLWQEKQDLIQQIINVAPRVPHHLDSVRVCNVLTEMNFHLRIAKLLPVMLFCDDELKMEQLGEDVNRTLQLMKLQLDLVNVQKQSKISNEFPEDDSWKTRNSPISVFALKETFYTLCINFRNTFDYRLLLSAEELFAKQMTKCESFRYIQQLSDLLATVTKIIIRNSERTPYDNRQMLRKIEAMEKSEGKSVPEKSKVFQQFDEQLALYGDTHRELQERIKQNQSNTFKALQEVRRKRAEEQAHLAILREEELNRHQHKMDKIAKYNLEAMQETKGLISQQYRMSRYYVRKIREREDAVKQLEMDVIQRNVLLKAEVLSTQNYLQSQMEILWACNTAEQAIGVEFKELLAERKLKEEERTRKAKELQILNNAATVVQKTWRGYVARKSGKKLRATMKRKRNGKGNKKGKTKSKDKSKSKSKDKKV